MDQILKPGQKVSTSATRRTCVVEKFLGGGGQGEVYQALLDGKAVALKWYYPASATSDQQKALETLVRMGAPSDRFLWPTELASAASTQGFGYIMPLREQRFRSIVDLMKRRIEPSFRALATAGLELSHSYLSFMRKACAIATSLSVTLSSIPIPARS